MLLSLLVAGLGMVVIIGWHLGLPAIIRLRPDFYAMQYLTALGFVACGLALASRLAQWSRLFIIITGGLVALSGALLLTEYVVGWSLGFETILAHLPSFADNKPLRPSPPTSICFTLLGLGLLTLGSQMQASRQSILIWVFGSANLALCLMALFGYFTGLTGTYIWGGFIGMAFHTAVCMFLLSIALFLTLKATGKSLSLHRWLPVPVTIGMATATLILWRALVADQRTAIQEKTALIAQDLRTDIGIRMNEQLNALDRMRRRWEKRGRTPYEEWKDDATAYLQSESIFDAIGWQNPDREFAWIVPEKERLLFAQLEKNPGWSARQSLEQSLIDHEIVLSPVVQLNPQEKGFLTYLPLSLPDRSDGFLVSIIRMRTFMDLVVDEPGFSTFVISAYEGDQLIYRSSELTAVPNLQKEITLEFHSRRWRFVVTPSEEFVRQNTSRLPDLILMLGFLLTATLALAIHGWQLSRKHFQESTKTNQILQEEIKARTRVESQLRESEERQRIVLDSALGVSVIATDPSGLITYFSKGSERLLGYRAEDIVGQVTPAILHDSDEVAERGRELTKQLGREIKDFDVFIAVPLINGRERREWTYICRDGSRKNVELTATVLHDEAGAITGFLGTAIDITARKRMEQELRKSILAAEKAQSLLEAAGRIARMGHWELTFDGQGPLWSDITYAIHEVPLGTPITLEEAIGFLHPEDQNMVRRHIRTSSRSGEPFEFEARLITAKKNQLWVHSRGEPLFDDTGRVIGLRGVFQDVNERHLSAEILSERNKQLEEATREALSYAKAKAEFLANMSHEIRTPLNAIIGMSEMLRESISDLHQKEMIETVHASSDVLLTLINDILDFSKIESGQLELERIPVDLHDCVESAFNIVSNLAARKKLDLLYWIDPAVPAFILGDITRLRQILVNLITNAVKFTDFGEVFVQIQKVQGNNTNNLLRFSVRDTGIGIPSDKQGRLFQAFSQVDSSTTRRFGGTGLGLAICQRLVGIMHGRIWVESQLGQGAEFLFELPLEPAAVKAPTIYLSGANHDLENMRVLLVDDNETNLWILESQTAAWGMQSRKTQRPEEALKWISQGDPFDLAILDGHMPGLNGYLLTERIRQYEHMRHTPVLILTSMEADQAKTAHLEKLAHLTKPVKTAALFQVISELILGQSAVFADQAPQIPKSLSQEYPLAILVAEDNPVNQRVISLQLNRLGYQPHIVSDGLEALASLQAKRFDLVLLDIQMPEMDGFSTAREICHLYPRPKRPHIVALTADASEDDRNQCLAAGMDDFLTKPVRSQELSEALRRAYQVIHSIS